MGIYDRDYARASGGMGDSTRPRLGLSTRGWSFTKWLIVINVAVFVFDAIALSSGNGFWVRTNVEFVAGAQFDPNALAYQKPKNAVKGPAIVNGPIVDGATGAIVGHTTWTRMAPLQAVGFFSTYRAFKSMEIWRFITFQFLHGDMYHLLFNMIGLFFFAPLVESNLGSRKRFAAFYLTCGIFGAFLYLLLNLIGVLTNAQVPALLHDSPYVPLIGASAGVFGVLMAAAYFAAHETMLLFMVIPLKVRTGAYLLALASLINLLRGGTNAGGDAAHIGGAIAGYFFVRNMHLLNDFFDVFGPGRTSSGPKKGRAPRNVARPPKKPGGKRVPVAERPMSASEEERLDAILKKVSEKGMDSLSGKERRFLAQATDEKRQG